MRRHIIEQLAARRGQGQHPGLILNRFLAKPVAGGGDPEERRAVLEAARVAGRDPSLLALYRRAFQRWRDSLPAVHAAAELATPPSGRLIVGLGNKGVLESGLRLHHTYGVPLIPGSALKGIASHYCAEVWGRSEPPYALGPKDFDPAKGVNYHRLLFGTTDDGGAVRFEDAWMLPDAQGLLQDVMTPHHQQWQTDADVAPTDFDSPVPVPFLSVAGAFRVAVCWQGPEDSQAVAWTQRALALLKEALKEWGVGGKTSSGYGRLVEAGATKQPAAQASAARPAGPPRKRDSGTKARVSIVGPREKGFDVQEEGRPPGVLTVGSPPAGVSTAPGSVVEVLVHNDDPRKPQYRWPAR